MKHAGGAALVALVSALGCASGESVERVKPQWVREHLTAASPPVFVCAYDAKDCQGTHPEGCITLEDLRSRQPAPSKDEVIVFCCG
jgi:hypothetical protein